MSTFAKTEILSASEIILLQQDVVALKKALKLTFLAAPLLLLFTTLSFYFSWGALALCICVVANVGTFYIMLVSYLQSRKIFSDLKENSKAIVPFVITHKKVMGYVTQQDHNRGLNNRRKVLKEIKISNDKIQEAVNNSAAYQKDGINIIFNQLGMANDNQILKHSYHYAGHFLFEEKHLEFLVPIQYYLTGNIGDTVTITYAPHSKKVFKVQTK